MADPVLQLPVGTVLRLPSGHTVVVAAGHPVTVPAGTIVEGTPGGTATHALAAATTVEATGTKPPNTGVAQHISTVEPAGQPPKPATHAAHGKPWNETPQGARLSGAYDAMRHTFAVTTSSQREQIRALANRHIGG